MPWTVKDVESHIKGLTDKQKEAWVSIANSTLDLCLHNGGNPANCEGKAIRIANAKAQEIKEAVTMKETKLFILTESVLAESQIDKENRIIHNVIILSKNSVDASGKIRRTYTDDCLDRSVAIFEGAPAYIDHPDDNQARQGRSVRDQYGFYRGVQHIGEKVIAKDLVLYDNPDAALVMSIAEKNPKSAGNSIHAAGKVRAEKGTEIVEEILPRTRWGHRSSVDLVDDPATTRGIFESREKGVTQMEWNEITVAQIQENRKDLYESIMMIGVSSRDGEVKILKEQLQTANKEVDDFKVKEALTVKKDLVERLLSESKLPAEAITDAFRGTLMNVQERKEGDKTITAEEGMKTLIEDRNTLINPGGVHGNNSKGPVGKGKGITLKECSGIFRRR